MQNKHALTSVENAASIENAIKSSVKETNQLLQKILLWLAYMQFTAINGRKTGVYACTRVHTDNSTNPTKSTEPTKPTKFTTTNNPSTVSKEHKKPAGKKLNSDGIEEGALARRLHTHSMSCERLFPGKRLPTRRHFSVYVHVHAVAEL